jgi:hypothetical protein
MSIVYGYDVEQTNDLFVTVIEEVAYLATHYAMPGALIVNTLPFRASIPSQQI